MKPTRYHLRTVFSIFLSLLLVLNVPCTVLAETPSSNTGKSSTSVSDTLTDGTSEGDPAIIPDNPENSEDLPEDLPSDTTESTPDSENASNTMQEDIENPDTGENTLSENPSETTPEEDSEEPLADLAPSVRYSSHIQDIGWQDEVKDGATSGTTGRNLSLQALKIQLDNPTDFSGDIVYSTHVENIGWQDAVTSNQIAGTTGRNLSVEAIKIDLTGDLKEHYDVYYRVHSASYGWLGWTSNGKKAGTSTFALAAQAIEIKICEKGDPNAPSLDQKAYISPETLGEVFYQTHSETIGWQKGVYDGNTAGTTGRNLQMEAFSVKLTDLGRADLQGSVVYSAHVQDIGWQDEAADGAIAGTIGKAKAIEALKINLTGQLADTYDIYYRVHSTNYGWLGWAKNGEIAGTFDFAYSAQAVQIKLYPKNSPDAPAQTEKSYYSLANLGSVLYRTHVQDIGWQFYNVDGQIAGTTGKALGLEGLTIQVTPEGRNDTLKGSVVYQAHVEDIGWQDEVKDGALSGTVGAGKDIQAIRIYLTDELEKTYDIYYRVHSANFGWLGWTKNGDTAGTIGSCSAIESIQIQLFEKDSPEAPETEGRSSLSGEYIGSLTYKANVKNTGWQTSTGNTGTVVGTTGQGKAITSVSMSIDSSNTTSAYSGTIEYSLHLSNIGWTDWQTDGVVIGDDNTTVEAIQIRLTGELSKYADIYYRTHVANYGWLDWAKNGQPAGTTKCNYSLQSLQLKLVPKYAGAPGSTANYYKDYPLPKTIGSFSTVATGSYESFYNMSRAISSFNGLIIYPGQTVSFFAVAGPCGPLEGYLAAPVVGGIGYGGGICQASTTLYGAALRAGMTIIERRNHSVPSTYVPIGQDAMVSFGTSDFKFRNDFSFPVTLKTYTSGRTIGAEFVGQDPGWFDRVAVNSWWTGTRSAAAERIFYKNNVAVRHDVLPSSYY